MSYEDLRRSGAVICKHVSYPERPILRATRHVPLEWQDSAWQFLCGVEAHDTNDGIVWSLEEVAALDHTLVEILEAKPKVSFERLTVSTAWRRVPYADKSEEF